MIDGSTRDSIMKATYKGSLTTGHKAAETKVELDGTIERTVGPRSDPLPRGRTC